jgi:hypothetical protein
MRTGWLPRATLTPSSGRQPWSASTGPMLVSTRAWCMPAVALFMQMLLYTTLLVPSSLAFLPQLLELFYSCATQTKKKSVPPSAARTGLCPFVNRPNHTCFLLFSQTYRTCSHVLFSHKHTRDVLTCILFSKTYKGRAHMYSFAPLAHTRARAPTALAHTATVADTRMQLFATCGRSKTSVNSRTGTRAQPCL